MSPDGFKSYCPDCGVEGRWHDGSPEDETATCRTCGHESTSEERHEARTESRVDDLTPALETADGDSDADQADLTGWSN